MANMMKMMKQAQAMQAKMQKMQDELAEREVEHSVAGGLVTCKATCDGSVTALSIDPKLVDPDDVEMLEDSVLAAVKGALDLGKETMAQEMSEITKGMNLPGMPF